MSKVFKALSDETRREILKLLSKIEILREAELISSERKGQFIIYSINTSVIQEVLGNFLSLFTK